MNNKVFLKILTFAGILCLSIPLILFGLWNYSFNHGTTQDERVLIFDSFFPKFLQGRWDTTYLSIAFSVLAITLCIICLKLRGKFWKSLNISVLVLSALLLFLNLFSMM